jgi:hypothetical protein
MRWRAILIQWLDTFMGIVTFTLQCTFCGHRKQLRILRSSLYRHPSEELLKYVRRCPKCLVGKMTVLPKKV